VHTNATLLEIGAIFAQNPTNKYDQPIVYASRLLNKAKHNYVIIGKEALTMVYALHKFKHFFVGKQFCLLGRPHVSGRIARWLLFLKYELKVLYKPSITHVVTNALSRLPDSS
jgi:hypothetical protein